MAADLRCESASRTTGQTDRQPKAFVSPSPTAVVGSRPKIRTASSSLSSPPKGRTGRGLAFGLRAVSRIVWAVRSECAAACILRRTALAFQFFCQTKNVNRALGIAKGRGLQGRGRGSDKGPIRVAIGTSERQKKPSVTLSFNKLRKDAGLSRQRSRVRAPSSPPAFQTSGKPFP